jgi:hypothetical protein
MNDNERNRIVSQDNEQTRILVKNTDRTRVLVKDSDSGSMRMVFPERAMPDHDEMERSPDCTAAEEATPLEAADEETGTTPFTELQKAQLVLERAYQARDQAMDAQQRERSEETVAMAQKNLEEVQQRIYDLECVMSNLLKNRIQLVSQVEQARRLLHHREKILAAHDKNTRRVQEELLQMGGDPDAVTQS